jgi:hypothetical protein
MGNAVHAQLVFGINFEEMRPFPETFEAFEDLIIAESGIEVVPYGDTAWDEFRNRVYDLERAYPLEIIRHCRGTYVMYILAARQPQFSSWRGETKIIDPAKLIVAPEVVAAMMEFCKRYDLPWTEPQWHLCPYSEE